jgi:hypothetical protein
MSAALLREMFEQMVIVKDDDEAWVQADDRLAARVFITTSLPGEKPTRIEVVLIATFLDGRIHRVWETTWPSWRTVEGFADY